ncbi:hypothetical protein SDD30_14280 [Moorella naiadis]|uniref:hypothetical protein n=1 Tax=Moorella naiadis (nom. illeg.) TaxID=3093670 RepID=UPI003D9CB8C2
MYGREIILPAAGAAVASVLFGLWTLNMPNQAEMLKLQAVCSCSGIAAAVAVYQILETKGEKRMFRKRNSNIEVNASNFVTEAREIAFKETKANMVEAASVLEAIKALIESVKLADENVRVEAANKVRAAHDALEVLEKHLEGMLEAAAQLRTALDDLAAIES